MSSRSLRPHLNQIRSWVQQGRTNAWIAHQLDVTGDDIESFKRENGLAEGEAVETPAATTGEVDLRAEDDAAVAAVLEKEAEEAALRENIFEGSFDHGDEGYGLWLDPGVQENKIYAENWAGHRSIEVTISGDQIVITRIGD